jgi:hypothetical protein
MKGGIGINAIALLLALVSSLAAWHSKVGRREAFYGKGI